jgi:hypothetical protein
MRFVHGCMVAKYFFLVGGTFGTYIHTCTGSLVLLPCRYGRQTQFSFFLHYLSHLVACFLACAGGRRSCA